MEIFMRSKENIFMKSMSFFLLLCFTLLVASCSKGQTEGVNNQQTQQKIVAADSNTGTKVNMSVEQKKELDDFLSQFAQAGLKPFTKDQLGDDELIRFALLHLGKAGKEIVDVSESQVESLQSRYFGKVAKGQEHQKYNSNLYVFESGVYKVVGKHSFGGFIPPFAQIDELRDCGDGMFAALVSVYSTPDGFEGDRHARPETWDKSNPDLLPELEGKYHAVIRLVRDNNKERYILLEYLKNN